MKRLRLKVCFFVVCVLACFLFVVGIYGNINVAKADNYTLQYSTFYSKPTWRTTSNCYTFAIGRYNEMNAGVHNPGYYSGLTYSKDKTVYQIADLIESDLVALLCTNITQYTECPNLENLPTNVKLICVRKAATDYHLMTYQRNVGWLHKNGTHCVLKYNYNDPSDGVWSNEYAINSATHIAGTMLYDSDIIYISYTTNFEAEAGRYEIGSYTDLTMMQQRPQDRWFLKNSVTIPSNTTWSPISNFSGFFDGGSNTISGLRFSGNLGNCGFISNLTDLGVVTNLILDNVEINATNTSNFSDTIHLGAIASTNNGGTILNCQVGTMRYYGEASILSSTNANIGAIAGVNLDDGVINSCSVQFFDALAFGNVGGIVGENFGSVNSSIVNNSVLNLYWGNVGGIVGKNAGSIRGCEVYNTDVSCYNGFPNIFPEKYPSSHYASAGGIVGLNTEDGYVDEGFISSVNIFTGNEVVDSDHGGRTFAPEIGFICGRNMGGAIVDCMYVGQNNSVIGNNLQTLTWWDWFTKKSWNQSQYVKSAEVGRSD